MAKILCLKILLAWFSITQALAFAFAKNLCHIFSTFVTLVVHIWNMLHLVAHGILVFSNQQKINIYSTCVTHTEYIYLTSRWFFKESCVSSFYFPQHLQSLEGGWKVGEYPLSSKLFIRVYYSKISRQNGSDPSISEFFFLRIMGFMIFK